MKIKNYVILLAFFFTTPVFALPLIGTPYAGAEGGLIFYPKPSDASLVSRLDVFAGRLFVGYQFLPIFGLEAGYSDLNSTRTEAQGDLGPDHFIANGYDLSGKFFVPLSCGFKLFASAGVAYIKQDAKNIFLKDDLEPIYESHCKELLPLVSAGIAYTVFPHVSLRLSWMHYVGVGEIKNIDFIPLGISISL